MIVRRAVDDDVGTQSIHRLRDGGIVGDIELAAGQRHRLMGLPELFGNSAAELAARARHDDAHQAAFSTLNFRICASSNTPSQRATTAVAMQLPITFTDVRPMSMI